MGITVSGLRFRIQGERQLWLMLPILRLWQAMNARLRVAS